jgi:hypothetical protein
MQPPADAGSPLADFSTLKMEAIRPSETPVNARSTQRHIPEDDILQFLSYSIHSRHSAEPEGSLPYSQETHRVVIRRGCHIFYTIGSEMALRLSALRAGRHLPPRKFLVLISVRGRVDPRDIVRLESLGQFKNPIISSENEPATFRLVA